MTTLEHLYEAHRHLVAARSGAERWHAGYLSAACNLVSMDIEYLELKGGKGNAQRPNQSDATPVADGGADYAAIHPEAAQGQQAAATHPEQGE